MGSKGHYVAYTCTCGFSLARVPQEVLEDLPRCLGCGRSLRAPATVRTHSVARVDKYR